jgi:hypothetical protein
MEPYQGGPVLTLYGVDVAQPLGVTEGWARGTLHPKHAIKSLEYHDIGVELRALTCICSNLIPGVNLIPAIAKGTSTIPGPGQAKEAQTRSLSSVHRRMCKNCRLRQSSSGLLNQFDV